MFNFEDGHNLVNGRILKANLSWTRKKVELEGYKIIFVCI